LKQLLDRVLIEVRVEFSRPIGPRSVEAKEKLSIRPGGYGFSRPIGPRSVEAEREIAMFATDTRRVLAADWAALR